MIIPDPRTELQILEEIYRRYFRDFISFDRSAPTRTTKNYVPIDIEAVARQLDTHPEAVFGTLHYRLDPKYKVRNEEDGSVAPFFIVGWPKKGSESEREIHLVNFGILPSVLAALREDHRRLRLSTLVSVAAFIVAVIALFKPS